MKVKLLSIKDSDLLCFDESDIIFYMSFLYTSLPLSDEDKHIAVADLLHNAVPNRDFYILVVGAILLALGGIFTDSIPVLIASMIVAPLMYPILATGLGVVVGDIKIVLRSLGMLLVSLVLAIGIAFIITHFFPILRIENTFISFGGSEIMSIAIAVISGVIATYGLVRSKVGGAMTGIGIAVSLMPPLVATGIGIAENNFTLSYDAFVIFLLNFIGILLASVITFAFMGIGHTYHDMHKK